MRQSKDPRHLRLKMVRLAREHGVKPAARLLACSPQTVRQWRDRYDGTLASLADHSRRPHRSPNQLPPEAERAILAAKRKLPTFGAERLKFLFALPYSAKAIRRVCRDHGLTRNWRRKKHETKRCLREIKRHWPVWRQIVMDTKILTDLPEYWAQAQVRRLPKHQYTARDVTTGALFLGFAEELSLTYAELFAERILTHLSRHGVDLHAVTVQTDNGSEFIGSWHAKRDSAFTRAIEKRGAVHRTIPPGAHRFQADVETVHGLMETEFYVERFQSRRDFVEKAGTYQLFFNTVRPNSGKENRCPMQLLPNGDLNSRFRLLHLTPVHLEDLLRQRQHHRCRVHHVRTYPWSAGRASRIVHPKAPGAPCIRAFRSAIIGAMEGQPCDRHPRPAVTVDIALLTRSGRILLIQRRNEPFKGCWALPGGFVEIDETLARAAARELEEETGVTGIALRPAGVFDDPGRDPRGRTISIAFAALLDEPPAASAGDDAADARWFDLAALPDLAFDHDRIIVAAQDAASETD